MNLYCNLLMFCMLLLSPVALAQDQPEIAELEYYPYMAYDSAGPKAGDPAHKLPIVLKPVTEKLYPLKVTVLAGPNKDETRVDLRQFGMRPTVVLVAGVTSSKPSKAYDEALSNAISAADKLAGGWAKKGIETLLMFNQYQGPTSDDGPVKSARPKSVSIVLADELLLCPQIPGLVLSWIDLRDLSKTSDTAARLEDYACWTQWMWMPEPSRIEALGGDWTDKRLSELVEASSDKLKPLTRDKRVAKVLDQIALLQIAKAVKGIGKLAAEPDNKRPSDDAMAALDERLQMLEQLQRRVLVRRHEFKGYVVEQVEQLEALGAAFAGHAIGDRVAQEVAVLKGTDSYALNVRAKPEYEKLDKRINEADSPINSTNESSQEHYRKILKAYGHLKAPLESFLKEYGESVYAEELRAWYDSICTAERESKG